MNLFFLAQAASGSSPAGFFFGLGAIGLGIALLLSIFWIWMLIDALTNPSLEGPMKIVWALVIFFLHILGALIYFFVARKGRTVPSA